MKVSIDTSDGAADLGTFSFLNPVFSAWSIYLFGQVRYARLGPELFLRQVHGSACGGNDERLGAAVPIPRQQLPGLGRLDRRAAATRHETGAQLFANAEELMAPWTAPYVNPETHSMGATFGVWIGKH